MIESPREQSILDKLINGEIVSIGSKSFGPFSPISIGFLQYIRSLRPGYLEPPLGRDKVTDLLSEAVKVFSQSIAIEVPKEALISPIVPKRFFKLIKVIAKNFRGLQNHGGPEFSFDFNSNSHLITGLNGTGKSSILNAIVWAFTGQLLWDRSEPAPPPSVDLNCASTNNSEFRSIYSNWPSHVAVPGLSLLQKQKIVPNCWVEVHLLSDDGTPHTVRRETIAGQEKTDGLNIFDPNSIDLGMLMPGRVNHIQFDKNSDFSRILMQVSGLEAIEKYGIYASSRGISPALTRYITDLTTQQSTKSKELQDLLKQAKGMLPTELIAPYDDIGKEEKSPVVKANKKIEWLHEKANEQLKQLVSLLNLAEQPSDLELSQLGRNILVAFEITKDKNPSSWTGIQSLLTASRDWDDAAQQKWSSSVSAVLSDLEMAVDWYIKQTETKNLRLKLIAAQLLLSSIEPNNCPLCEQELPPEHLLRQELPKYREVDELALKSLTDIASILLNRLSSVLPASFSHLNTSSIDALILEEYDKHIGLHLTDQLQVLNIKGREALTLASANLSNISSAAATMTLANHTGIGQSPQVLDLVNSIQEEIVRKNKIIALAEWAKLHLETVIEDIAIILGYKADNRSGSVLDLLNQATNIASSSKPIENAEKILKTAIPIIKQYIELHNQINIASKTKEALIPLEQLKNLAEETLKSDLQRVEQLTCDYYSKMYGEDNFSLKKVMSKRVNKNILLSFLFSHQNLLMEGAAFLNASRIRALLWAYVFALSEVGYQYCNTSWIAFSVLDEPLTSLDQEHQRNFAKILFDPNSFSQYIVCSHDLRWPLELQRQTALNLKAKYCHCYGLGPSREVVRVSAWTSELEKKWALWIADETIIELGRDYVEAARIWCEDELKDLLIWSPEPATARDTLSPLLTKLETAYTRHQLYQIDDIHHLCTNLRKIETDLQNSHHGCQERNSLFKNEVKSVHKNMKEIPGLIEKTRHTLHHRLGVSSIV